MKGEGILDQPITAQLGSLSANHSSIGVPLGQSQFDWRLYRLTTARLGSLSANHSSIGVSLDQSQLD